jgi:hypothetical protein
MHMSRRRAALPRNCCGITSSNLHVLAGKSKAAKPTYYMVFVTSYRAGIIPDRLTKMIQKGSALAEIVVVAPDVLEQKMTFVNADDMKRELHDTGKVALYGILFDILISWIGCHLCFVVIASPVTLTLD